MGRFGRAVAKGAVALAIGTASMSAFVPAAHAVDGCFATVEVVDDAGHMVSQNVVPCTGGMQNGHAYLYDTHGTYLGEVSDGGPPDPPLVPLSPSHHSGGGSSGSTHPTTSHSTTGAGSCGSTVKHKPAVVRGPSAPAPASCSTSR
jgi:hypothetical protein